MADTKITGLTAETAPVDADLLAMVDDVAGTPVTKKVTFANAALSAPWASRYAPLITYVWVPAGAFVAVNGTPVLGDAGSDVPAFLMDAASTERIAAVTLVPDEWTTFNIQIVWTNAGAGSGNVAWQAGFSGGFGDGESMTVSSGTLTAVAAPVQDTAKFTTLESGLTAPANGELQPIRIARVGGDASDTLGNDAGLVGVRLVRAS